MKICDSIVPLFGRNHNTQFREFIGTAFIVEPNFIITAGHNIGNMVGLLRFLTFSMIILILH